jgi:hypothetical protein
MIERGSEIAIMPREKSPPQDVLEIATVLIAGTVFVQVMDGRQFCTIGCKSLGSDKVSYFVPATDEHRSALRTKAN